MKKIIIWLFIILILTSCNKSVNKIEDFSTLNTIVWQKNKWCNTIKDNKEYSCTKVIEIFNNFKWIDWNKYALVLTNYTSQKIMFNELENFESNNLELININTKKIISTYFEYDFLKQNIKSINKWNIFKLKLKKWIIDLNIINSIDEYHKEETYHYLPDLYKLLLDIKKLKTWEEYPIVNIEWKNEAYKYDIKFYETKEEIIKKEKIKKQLDEIFKKDLEENY